MSGSAAARSEAESVALYVGAVAQAVACFAANVAFRRSSFIDPMVGGRSLSSGGAPFRLHDRHGTAVVALRISLHYQPLQVSTAPRQWETRTVQYIFDIDGVGAPNVPIVAYHWHPSAPETAYAHCHARAESSPIGRLHLPTQFILLGDIFRWLMRDFEVCALSDQWGRALQRADDAIAASLRWAASLDRA